MTVLEFIGHNYTYLIVEEFKKKYSANRSRSAIYQLLNADIKRLKWETLAEMANHFAGGNIKEFQDLIITKTETQHPERPEER